MLLEQHRNSLFRPLANYFQSFNSHLIAFSLYQFIVETLYQLPSYLNVNSVFTMLGNHWGPAEMVVRLWVERRGELPDLVLKYQALGREGGSS